MSRKLVNRALPLVNPSSRRVLSTTSPPLPSSSSSPNSPSSTKLPFRHLSPGQGKTFDFRLPPPPTFPPNANPRLIGTTTLYTCVGVSFALDPHRHFLAHINPYSTSSTSSSTNEEEDRFVHRGFPPTDSDSDSDSASLLKPHERLKADFFRSETTRKLQQEAEREGWGWPGDDMRVRETILRTIQIRCGMPFWGLEFLHPGGGGGEGLAQVWAGYYVVRGIEEFLGVEREGLMFSSSSSSGFGGGKVGEGGGVRRFARGFGRGEALVVRGGDFGGVGGVVLAEGAGEVERGFVRVEEEGFGKERGWEIGFVGRGEEGG